MSRPKLTADQTARLRQIARVTRRLDGCPSSMMPVCGDLVELGLVVVHDRSAYLTLWVEPSSLGWELAGWGLAGVADE